MEYYNHQSYFSSSKNPQSSKNIIQIRQISYQKQPEVTKETLHGSTEGEAGELNQPVHSNIKFSQYQHEVSKSAKSTLKNSFGQNKLYRTTKDLTSFKRQKEKDSSSQQENMKKSHSVAGNLKNIAHIKKDSVSLQELYHSEYDKYFERSLPDPFFIQFMHKTESKPTVDYSTTVLRQEQIQQDYRFKLPNIQQYESQNTFQHYLGGFQHTFIFIEEMIKLSQKHIEQYKAEIDELNEEMRQLKQKYEQEIEEISTMFHPNFQNIIERVKQDFVKNQSENFRLQKEITLLNRDKLNLEQEINKCLARIKQQDEVLFKDQMFDLETDNKEITDMTAYNLRPEFQHMIQTKTVIH